MAELETLLRDAPRCLLAVGGAGAPKVWPLMFWWDGRGVWTTGDAVLRDALAPHPSRCGLYVPPLAVTGEGAVASGTARIYTADDPVPLALHAPVLAGAMTSLALKEIGMGVEMIMLALQARAVIRVLPDDWRRVRTPAAGPGMAPALPAVVPSDVRRAVGGTRRVVHVFGGPPDVQFYPGTWGSGFVLEGGPLPAAGTSAAVTVIPNLQERRTPLVGLTLEGELDDHGRLAAERATWWRGVEAESADIEPALGDIEFPD